MTGRNVTGAQPEPDAWHCVCGYKHPVATMVTWHRERCEVARPRVVAA